MATKLTEIPGVVLTSKTRTRTWKTTKGNTLTRDAKGFIHAANPLVKGDTIKMSGNIVAKREFKDYTSISVDGLFVSVFATSIPDAFKTMDAMCYLTEGNNGRVFVNAMDDRTIFNEEVN